MNDDTFAQLSSLYPELDAAVLKDDVRNAALVAEVPAGTRDRIRVVDSTALREIAGSVT